ncbi:MAG TPA: hypothetical protein VJR92_11295 [Gemmatimonadaceae bacterium]|nr:hypothetical protein [Gemmatimonadaceae bacterium]
MTRRYAVVVAAVCALVAGLAVISPAPVGVFWDDGVYLITAKALATGEGYRYVHLPGAPSASHFPPLWPALLSIVWRIAPDFPDNVRLMKLVNPILLAIGAGATVVLASHVTRVRAWLAALVVVAVMSVAPFLMLSSVVMSEPLGLALAAPALVFATRIVMRGRDRDAVWAGVFTGLAILARSACIALIPALLVSVCWKRSRRAGIIASGIAVALALPWFVWSSAHAHELGPALVGSYGPYGSWAIDAYVRDPGLMLAVIGKNLVSAPRDFAVVLFGGFPPAMRMYFVVPFIAMCAVGVACGGRRIAPVFVALVVYTALVIVWPYAPGRFLWAMFPVYAVACIAATVTLSRFVRRRFKTARSALITRYPVPLLFSVLALAMVIRYDVRGFQRGWHGFAIDQLANDVVGPVGWIARNTAPTDTIASDVHLMTYLYADRIGVPLNLLTVEEYIRPKTVGVMRAELAAVDSAFHPRWWIATGSVPQGRALVAWASEPATTLVPVANLPNGGLAARTVTR